jgi:hypothetical protein
MENRSAARGVSDVEAFWFPGRWIGGCSLVLGPILLLVGTLLRIQFDFFFPAQLAAVETHPGSIAAAYGVFLAGIVCLWPAILTLTRAIGQTNPGWALWGGTLAMLGLFKRAFDYGASHFALQLVDIQGVDAATRSVGKYYGAFEGVARTLGFAALFGWIVLAVGTYKSGVFGIWRSVALSLMAGLMLGVVKGSTWFSVLQIAGLCVALVPLGITVMRDGPRPNPRIAGATLLAVIVVTIAAFFLGQAG